MIDLLIYQRNVGYIGEISEYESLEITRNYYEVSKMVLRVPKTPSNASLLKQGNIITTSSNVGYGYYIDHFSAINEDGNEIIEIFAFSLNYILSFRTIMKQMRYSGNVETVIKSFIQNSAITPEDPRRIIDGLVLGDNTGVQGSINVSRTGGDLLSNSFDISREFEASIDVVINNNGEFEVLTWSGLDRSIEQSTYPNVIFSTEYDNVLSQNYFANKLDYKNVVLVAGEGEGVNRKVLEVGTTSGWDRRELYVDARDLSSEYQDENGNNITLTNQEYQDILRTRGLEKISEQSEVESFESTIDDVQYILGVDYNLGDKVTFLDTDLNITKSVRVTSITTTINKDGIRTVPSFGTGIPNKLINKEVN